MTERKRHMKLEEQRMLVCGEHYEIGEKVISPIDALPDFLVYDNDVFRTIIIQNRVKTEDSRQGERVIQERYILQGTFDCSGNVGWKPRAINLYPIYDVVPDLFRKYEKFINEHKK